MSAQGDAQPIIIKRKKKGGGDGHHGGAWKVAYADFVTAMMAFFLLMWLLNATTEKQRMGIADFFSPTIPVNRVSGGGAGAFGGDSVFAEETLPQNGTGATATNTTEARQARGEKGTEDEGDEVKEEDVFESLEKELVGKGGESKVMENALEHINTRVTDEGLIIEVFSRPGATIFEGDSDRPTDLLRVIALMIADTAKIVTNGVAIGGHVEARPLVMARNPVWELSAAQATAMRKLLENSGISPRRIERISGHADREPSKEDPMAIENNRLEIILLRE